MFKAYLFFFFLLVFIPVFSQEHVSNEVLVQLDPGVNVSDVVEEVNDEIGLLPEFRAGKVVSAHMRITLFHFNESVIRIEELLNVLRKTNGVTIAQANHMIHERLLPDDPFFSQQWHHMEANDHDIDSELAWDVTTGGTAANGAEIVACVVELGGAKWDVADIVDNHWVNEGEIEENGLDDDNNGYVDDYHGWKTSGDNDDISPGSHGTKVSSMIGSTGNNNSGVTGVNWNVKIMQVEIGSANEASAIEGYMYPLVLRRDYNLSGGTEGAFVVVTNSSWGIDEGQPEDSPLWCAMYDSLGHYGIISCASTANDNVNIDEVGDLPTGCSSDFMISVTATNNDDERTFSGYGIESIDLGAPGDDVYTATNSGYGTSTGTSFAGPCVAGAVALLYAAPCATLMNITESDPEQAALIVKGYIMDGVDETEQLLEESVSGGRLNVNNSMTLAMSNCGSCVAPFGVSLAQIPSTLDYEVSWNELVVMDMFEVRYRQIGTTEWTTSGNILETNYLLAGLLACTNYELQVMSHCDTGDSNWTAVYTWTTDGCCENPEGLELITVTGTTAYVSWNNVIAASAYTITATPESGSTLTFESIDSVAFELTGLQPCMDYEISVSSVCAGNPDPTASLNIHTPGCTDCAEMTYCTVSTTQFDDFIQHVTVASIDHQSGSDNGYVMVTDATTILNANSTYTITVTPGYGGISYDENFRAWIDYNSDGEFDPVTELIFDPESPATSSISGQFTVPLNIQDGVVRLRVAMRYAGFQDTDEPTPCGSWTFGEIEDYCVTLDATINVDEQQDNEFVVYPNPANGILNLEVEGSTLNKVTITSSDGRIISVTNGIRVIDISGFSKGLYQVIAETSAGVYRQVFIKE